MAFKMAATVAVFAVLVTLMPAASFGDAKERELIDLIDQLRSKLAKTQHDNYHEVRYRLDSRFRRKHPSGFGSSTRTVVITDSQKSALENAINEARRNQKAADMHIMRWNNELADLAQQWSDQCEFSHGTPLFDEGEVGFSEIGQNNWAFQGSLNPQAVVKDWLTEKKFYDEASGDCRGGGCTHFRQLVWSTSTDFGCAVTSCGSIGTIQTGGNFMVCYFGPAGNFEDEPAYTPATSESGPCTKCASGKFYCNNDLCDATCTQASSTCVCKAACKNCGTQTSDCGCKCNAGSIGVDCSSLCVDQKSYCKADYGTLCYLDFVQEICAKTCKVCGGGWIQVTDFLVLGYEVNVRRQQTRMKLSGQHLVAIRGRTSNTCETTPTVVTTDPCAGASASASAGGAPAAAPAGAPAAAPGGAPAAAPGGSPSISLPPAAPAQSPASAAQSSSSASEPPPTDPSQNLERGLTDGQKQRVLFLLNKHRAAAGASNMNILVWDDNLAKIGQEWSDRCIFEHRYLSSPGGNGYVDPASVGFPTTTIGENIWAFSDNSQVVPDAAVEAWDEEKNYYDFATATCQPGKDCGHYIANMWAYTRAVGCGFTKCASVQAPGAVWPGGVMISCNFAGGADMDKQPFALGPACTECSSGKSYCTNNLCDSTCTSAGSGGVCECNAQCKHGSLSSGCSCHCSKGYMGAQCDETCRNLAPECDSDWAFTECSAELLSMFGVSFMYEKIVYSCPLLCGQCVESSRKAISNHGRHHNRDSSEEEEPAVTEVPAVTDQPLVTDAPPPTDPSGQGQAPADPLAAAVRNFLSGHYRRRHQARGD